MHTLRLFGLDASRDFALGIAEYLDVELSRHVEKYFPDREPYMRSEVNVRNCDVYVVQSLYSDDKESVADKLIKLMIFVGSLRQASARRVTVVAPYLCFARQDRKTESRAPVSSKYFCRWLKASGARRLLSIDPHNLSAFQNGLDILSDFLEARPLFIDHIASAVEQDNLNNLVILSPDKSIERAIKFRNTLEKRLKKNIGSAYLDKRRIGDNGELVDGNVIVGDCDIQGKDAIIVDDIISTGSSIKKCYEVAEKSGCRIWSVCATHGVFVGNFAQNTACIPKIIVTDSIVKGTSNMANLTVLSTAKLFGKAIRRIHNHGGSISDLLK
jgi:ribose-phosphate pyrophosphokinase